MGVWRASKKLVRPQSEAGLKLEIPLAAYFGPSLQIIRPLAQQNAVTSHFQHLQITHLDAHSHLPSLTFSNHDRLRRREPSLPPIERVLYLLHS